MTASTTLKNPPKIYVAGHRGLVGSAIVRRLLRERHPADLTVTRTRQELDLLDHAAVDRFLHDERPNYVYLAAAKVGGIKANNSRPADFIYENLVIQTNVIGAAFRNGVKKLLFLGSSCIYPRLAQQPMSEEVLLTGPLEPTNEPYAVAKIAGIKLCESFNRQYGAEYGINYRSVMPTNLYGPGDNYHPENSHVIPALIRKFHDAKKTKAPKVTIWGTGLAKREFLFVDDMADACKYVMDLPNETYDTATAPMRSFLNVGSGEEVTIRELAHLIAETIGYTGKINMDTSKPDGAPRKLMNSSRLRDLGWRAKVSLPEGLRRTYMTYLDDQENDKNDR
jgi:GDP-L-fucose synthase